MLCKCGKEFKERKQNGIIVSRYCSKCLKAKTTAKKEKHKQTKKGQQEIVKKLIRKADKLLQEKGRELFKNCEVCGGEYSCLHHFYTKSSSFNLRYDWRNLIPICNSCHVKHHNGQDPSIHGRVIIKRGIKWFEELSTDSKKILLKTPELMENIIKNI